LRLYNQYTAFEISNLVMRHSAYIGLLHAFSAAKAGHITDAGRAVAGTMQASKT